MAIDSRAFLQQLVPNRGIDFGGIERGINTAIQAKQNEVTNAQNQARIDQQNAKDKQKIAESGNKLALEEYGRDLVGIKSLRGAADNLGVVRSLNERRKRILAKKGDAGDTEHLIKLFDENPERFDALVASEIDGLIRTEVIITDGTFGGTRGTLNINAPIRLVKKGKDGKTTESMLVSPQAHKVTGELTLDPFNIPEGFELAKETAEEKRVADVLAKQQIEINKLQAQQDIEPQTAAAIDAAKKSVAKADQVFDQIDNIRQNNINLQIARQAVVDGAGTGPLLSLLPSFRAQSVALDAAQGRLGLDVVGSVTFGALSKGELDLAKSVALPTGLTGEPLLQWIDDKIDANLKAAAYMERQGLFLSEKNAEGKQNGKSDWVKSERAAMEAALKDGEVTDADIERTMRDMGMDRSAVLAEIRRRFESGS